MVTQYPYTLWALLTGAGTRNDSGDYMPVSAEWVPVARCRDEANTAGKTVVLADSTESVYDWLVQLPKGSSAIPFGTRVEVRDSCSVRASGTVKRFSSDQLHCRVWL